MMLEASMRELTASRDAIRAECQTQLETIRALRRELETVRAALMATASQLAKELAE